MYLNFQDLLTFLYLVSWPRSCLQDVGLGSSVSLRDVVRFRRFYEWFYKYFDQYKSENLSNIPCNKPTERASLFALFLCYYFRLSSNEARNEYMKLISDTIKDLEPDVSPDILHVLLDKEKMVLINQMVLPPGTGKNRALTDNIFVLFTCIVNQIPVILCGKPGSSKTSALQIVINSLRGEQSEDPFLREQARLTAIYYQGSHNCTSESIVKTFAQADKVADAQAKKDVKLLPVIVFDEIGLAEFSPHNPLKVLHKELEIETCRHGFVGLSNWRLDASKMNRAIYLCCPDFDFDDLQRTAASISESILLYTKQAVPLEVSVIEALANSYLDLCEHMKQQKIHHYFGLRDYYSLIKGIVYNLCETDNGKRDLYEIIQQQLSVNFDGTFNASNFMWVTFCKYMKHEHKITAYSSPTFAQLISSSLTSRNGRFLMLIGNNESSFDYIQRYIKTGSSTQTRTLIGSTLVDDLLLNNTYSEPYNIRILMDIIRFAEKDVTLFLRNLGHLYDNLYDLFNQNFSVSEKKKFCRIALGSTYHPRCRVHNGFYCVIFVKTEDLKKYDPPFLNRFEKHLIDIESLIDQHHETVMNQLNRFVKELISSKLKGSFLTEKHLFLDFNKNYILNLVTAAFDENKLRSLPAENVYKQCQKQMISTSSFDLPLLLSMQPSDTTNTLLTQYYDTHTVLSFSSFINQFSQQDKIPPLLIYTYTHILHPINFKDIKNEQRSVDEVKLSHFKTELELIEKIKMHYRSSSRFLFIRVDYHRDQRHLPMLKHNLLNEHIADNNHGICLIFHLQRNKLHQVVDDICFTGWLTVMIDDLQENQLIPQEILLNPSYAKVIDHLQYLQTEEIFDELIEQSFMKFSYRVTNESLISTINEHRDQMVKQLARRQVDNDLPSLRSLVKNHLLKMIQTPIADPNQTRFKDWRKDLLTNEIVIGSCRSIEEAVNKTIFSFLEIYLSVVLAHLEKNALIDAHYFLGQSSGELRTQLHELWSNCWEKTIEAIDMSIVTQSDVEIPLVSDLHLPCAAVEYEVIRQIRYSIAEQHDNDNDDGEKNKLGLAYQQLLTKSTYGEKSINKILDDKNLFDYYYHDQLALTQNEANIHHLSTSLRLQLLTSKTVGTSKDLLRYLLVDYEELWEIMRIFEICISFIGESERLCEILDQQFIRHSDVGATEKNVGNSSKFYRLLMRESDYCLIYPGSIRNDQNIFECKGDPFIGVSLLNVFELLISPAYVIQVNDIKKIITTYTLLIQSATALTAYGHYKINNLEKVRSLLRLASCLSTLLPTEKVLDAFIHIFSNYGYGISFDKLDDLHRFILHLNDIVRQSPIVDDFQVRQTLLKFENEILIIWSISNEDQFAPVLKFIHDHKLWRFAGKTLNFIDRKLDILSIADEEDQQLADNEKYTNTCINDCLIELGDQTYRMEVLMGFRVYMQLVLDDNFQPKINEDDTHFVITTLTDEFEQFKEHMDKMDEIGNNGNRDRLKLISLTAWCRYFLLCYIYALKCNITDDIMDDIHNLFAEKNSACYLTMKLYTIKQLCCTENITYHDLCRKYIKKSIKWISSAIIQPSDRQRLNARRRIILPTPLFGCSEEFKRIDNILKPTITSSQLKQLINECGNKQDTAYCFLLWFIHYYTRFYPENTSVDEVFVKQIETDDIKDGLTTHFETIGYKLIYSLCTNFDEMSYFRLEHSMAGGELHKRLLVLNIIALILSFKSAKNVFPLSSLLFDSHLKQAPDYAEHFDKFASLTGVALANDRVLMRMIHIQTQIREQNQSKINIIRCSSNCRGLFYYVDCKISGDQKRCPACKKDVNVWKDKNALIINKPHLEMSISDTLHFIAEYIDQHGKSKRTNMKEKPNHLNYSLTYHFIDFFTNAIFLFLHELNYMPFSSPAICKYFRDRLTNKYNFIGRDILHVDQCYIWLYKLLNHMIDEDFQVSGTLILKQNVIDFESSIEEKLIRPHIKSVTSEIRIYKEYYAHFVFGETKQDVFNNLVDESVQDVKYSLLQFFNVTNIHSIDLLDDCYNRLRLLSDYKKNYPLTTFLLERFPSYENIPYLHVIVRFTNCLIQNLNYRIQRNDATKKTISQFYEEISDLKVVYKQFLRAASKIKVDELNLDQEKLSLDDQQWQNKFDEYTKISMFLLDKSQNSESKILVAHLQTLAKLQNDIVDCFHAHVTNDRNNDQKINSRIIPIQSVQPRHLFNYDRNQLRKFIVEKGLTINPEYGMSQEIIYYYDEIEWILRSKIADLPRIDVQNMSYFNYQFELYDENVSVINYIRERFEQKLLNDAERSKVKKFVEDLDEASILQLSDSLKYIFAYLRTVTKESIRKDDDANASKILTISAFCDHYRLRISTKFQDKPLASIQLNYIVDLYEIIEEKVFDKILYRSVKDEFHQKISNNDEMRSFIGQFINMITDNNQIADCLKDLTCWISMFKCLLTRLQPLKAQIDFDLPLADYVKRLDMWKGNIKKEDLQTIQIKGDVRLKHAFGILERLQTRKKAMESSKTGQDSIDIDYKQGFSKNIEQEPSVRGQTKNTRQSKKPKKTDDFF